MDRKLGSIRGGDGGVLNSLMSPEPKIPAPSSLSIDSNSNKISRTKKRKSRSHHSQNSSGSRRNKTEISNNTKSQEVSSSSSNNSKNVSEEEGSRSGLTLSVPSSPLLPKDKAQTTESNSLNSSILLTLQVPTPRPGSVSLRPPLHSSRLLSTPPPSSINIAQIDKAIREHKVFCMVGVYPAIRSALKKRGWIEKIINTTLPNYVRAIIGPQLNRDVVDSLGKRSHDDEGESSYCARVLANYPPDFIWVIRRDNITWNALSKDQMINRYPRAFFTTKVGIAVSIQSIHWFTEPGFSNTYFPRCYRLCIDEEKQAFLDDYRLTACISLLRWFCLNYEKGGESAVYDAASKISPLSLDFALRQVNNYMRMRRHEDIDWLMPPAFLNQHWEVFLNQYYAVVHAKGKLGPNESNEPSKNKYEICKRTLGRLSPYWGSMRGDGIQNLWICKPGARSRGKGILVQNNLEKIIGLMSMSNSRECNWVVQKYIERPMLIYKTKFDLRQWFIVTDWLPLTIWFAKESYIRFCSKPFNLEDFHESIHLCNNAVQAKYQNALNRDPALPDDNMWDCYTFQAYLKTIGKLEYWDKVIYPGMKESIIGIMLASQESCEVKKNSFELYGADFMFTEDLTPWLIEINSCPCMAGSTSVTARMCPQCLEDTIKVVIDRKANKDADTGMFELIYKQNINTTQQTMPTPTEFTLSGKKLTKDVDWPGILTKYGAKHSSSSKPTPSKASLAPETNKPKEDDQESPLTFNDLVQRLRLTETAKILSPPSTSSPDDKNLSSLLTTAGKLPLVDLSQKENKIDSSDKPSKSGRDLHVKSKSGKGAAKILTITPKNVLPKKSGADMKSLNNLAFYAAMVNNSGPNWGRLGGEANFGALDYKDGRGGGVRVRTPNNNNYLSPVHTLPLSVRKTETLPNSYLMYNPRSSPVTISDMIREYELSNRGRSGVSQSSVKGKKSSSFLKDRPNSPSKNKRVIKNPQSALQRDSVKMSITNLHHLLNLKEIVEGNITAAAAAKRKKSLQK